MATTSVASGSFAAMTIFPHQTISQGGDLFEKAGALDRTLRGLRRVAAVLVVSLVIGAKLGAAAVPEKGANLKDVYGKAFLIGAAMNRDEVSGRSPAAERIVCAHYNTITPENDMKWDSLQPRAGEFNFASADRYVEFGRKHGLAVIGHTLVWHSQTPAWVFTGPDGKPASRELLLARMEAHIQTVVGRYRGKIKGWDVVNEAVSDGPEMLRPSPWLTIIGADFLEKAYEFAHAADPDAELYYNDYSLENDRKRENAIQLLKNLKAKGVFLTGVGLQGHYNLHWPETVEIDRTIRAFAELGLKVMITELDIDVLPRAWNDNSADVGKSYASDPQLNPYVEGLPRVQQERLSARYGELFAVFLKNQKDLTRVTFWGVADGGSWLNHFPVRGRTNYPLLFDRGYRPKPAYEAVLQAASLNK